METVNLKDMLKFSFYLSKWFSGQKQDKIIPGASFLFLTQVSFLFIAALLCVYKLLPTEIEPAIVAAVSMLFVSFIMYGLQKEVQKRVRKNNYNQNYKTLTTKQIFITRVVALVIFIIPFMLCFAVAILFYR